MRSSRICLIRVLIESRTVGGAETSRSFKRQNPSLSSSPDGVQAIIQDQGTESQSLVVRCVNKKFAVKNRQKNGKVPAAAKIPHHVVTPRRAGVNRCH